MMLKLESKPGKQKLKKGLDFITICVSADSGDWIWIFLRTVGKKV